jgi:nucleotide-binding universal stress UspA family protein
VKLMDEKGFRKILVGYDGSDGAERAVALTVELAQKYEATVVVCHAFGAMPMTSKPSEVRRLINPVVERLTKLGIGTIIAIPDSMPAEGILDSAEQHKVDLIILGSRGRGTFANLPLGSTAERVIRYAKVSVLIAR